jgi:hypothetical protein
MIYLLRGLLFACEAVNGELDGTELGENELSELYKLSKKHDLAHLVGAALEKRGLLPAESEMAKKFQREQYLALYRCENLEYECGSITKVFDDVGIEYVLLKGAVIRKLYPEAWMRTSCDIDILVRESELDRACEALVERLGYSSDKKKDYHDISLYSGSGFHLELHYNIKENTPSIDPMLEKVWDHTKETGKYSRALTNEFLMFHVIAHTAYHFAGGGCGVRALIDIKFLRDKITYDENKLRELLSRAGLEKFCENLFALCDAWFADREHNGLTLEMQEYVLGGGVYGIIENSLAAKRGRVGGRASYVLSRIFMPYRALKIHYPVLEKHKILMPICQVARWGKLLSPQKRKRIAREIHVNSEVTRDDALRILDLFDRVGLKIEKK